jgi:hypothetical protein
VENPERMKGPLREPRRPNLATIVGSGLAVAAAGSLLAFSSLAEQAGLRGLATGGLQPTVPGRGGGTRAIVVSAPAAPDGEPATAEETLRELVARVGSEDPVRSEPVVATAPVGGPVRRRPAEKDDPARRERRDPVLAARRTATAAPEHAEAAEAYGPPYGKAKGHDERDDPAKSKTPRKQKRVRSQDAPEGPVYAKTNRAGGKSPKAPKMKRVTRSAPASHGNSKGRGHDKHAHGKGKGKGHGKHGH